jgi:crotonobetainyl-CoA:carnitine CoA-transferase CaiB-like acyl-CoA transferase
MGEFAATRPLLDFWTAARAAAAPPGSTGVREPPTRERPAAGLRVLDLTRVIAGPVGTRTLAALGADVLRIDAPGLPEIAVQHLDTGPDKRTALVDLRTAGGRAVLHDLLRSADVLVEGYRPGALAALGLEHDALTRRYPRLVTVRLSAWGHEGPWAGRRGFDSIVQSACGIAAVCGDGEQPGVLPAQVLDHATGHLVAAAALRGLTSRAATGRPGHARLALARTAAWLLAAPAAGPVAGPVMATATGPATAAPDSTDGSPYAVQLPSSLGMVTQIAPPGTLDDLSLHWSSGAHPWGTDLARWP